MSPEPPAPAGDHQPQPDLERLTEELQQARAELNSWRDLALQRWEDTVTAESIGLRKELDAMRRSISWRVTRPLRVVRTRAAARRTAL